MYNGFVYLWLEDGIKYHNRIIEHHPLHVVMICYRVKCDVCMICAHSPLSSTSGVLPPLTYYQ